MTSTMEPGPSARPTPWHAVSPAQMPYQQMPYQQMPYQQMPLAAARTRPPRGGLQIPRGPRVASLALTPVVIGISLLLDHGAIGVVAAVFVLVVPFERCFPRHPQALRRPHVGTDLAFALSAPLLSTVGLAAGIVVSVLSLAWLPGLLLRPLVDGLPDWLQTLTGIVLFDFVTYWAHRFAHEVPAGWRFHRVHHSTRHLDWVSGFRSHPFDGLLVTPAFVFLLAAGFSAELSGALVIGQIVIGLFLHANVRWRCKPLHTLVITPEFHHWHHSNEPEAHGSNYAVGLPVWDLVFGTYHMPKDRRPGNYGIDEPVPHGMLAQLWEPVADLPRPWRIARHPLAFSRRGLLWTRRTIGQMRLSVTGPPRPGSPPRALRTIR